MVRVSFNRKLAIYWNKIAQTLFEKGELHYTHVAFILGISPTTAAHYCRVWAENNPFVEYVDGKLMYKGEEEKEGE